MQIIILMSARRTINIYVYIFILYIYTLVNVYVGFLQ